MWLTRIDRYLLFLYFRVLLICFASISGLLIVIHVFSNLDSFNRHSAENELTLLDVFVDYYGPYTLSVFERLSAMLALLAMLFTLGWLNRTNELTALLAAGITKRRILRPLWLASGVVIFSAVAMREIAIPPFQDRLDRSPQDLAGDFPRPIRPAYDPELHALIQGHHLLPIEKSIVDLQVKFRGGPVSESLGNKLVAAKAYYLDSTTEHPAGYLIEGVQQPRNIDKRASVANASKETPMLMTPVGYSWLQSGSCFLASDVKYEMLRGGSAWKQFASTYELVTHLKTEKSPSSGDDMRVSIHQRFVRPAIDFVVLLLGIPILLSRPDRHMFWVAGVSLGVVGGFTALTMGLSAMGASSYLLKPNLSVWLPLLLFLPWGWAKLCNSLNT